MTANTTHTVPIGYVKTILSRATEEGVDIAPLLAKEGLTTAEINNRETLDAETFGAIYQAIMTITQDEYFGMLSAGKLPNGTFRMMCHAIIHASTLGSAIRRASDFHEICKGANIKPVLDVEGKTATMRFTGLDHMSTEESQAVIESKPKTSVCTTLSMWHHFISWLIGQKIPLIAAHFAFPEALALPQSQTIFQSPVRFNEPISKITFSRHYLDYPIVHTEATLHSFLKTAPYQLLTMVEDEETLSAQVVALIGRDCSIPPPTATEVAQALNISTSTLRRRLMEEGTSYQLLKDETRKESAVRYIMAPQLAISEVAALMGFEELSAFYRSFKRWTGKTPNEYRQSSAEDSEFN